jgi:hypothetical protein
MKHPKAKRDWEIRQLLRARLRDQLRDSSGGFLTIHEVWSEQGELIYFSYHYQIPDPARWRFFRYDREMPDPPPTDKPRHHLHVCSELHFATGPVKLEEVMNTITELFKRQAGGQEAL